MRLLLFVVLILLYPCLLFAQPKKWTLKECINEALKKNTSLNQNELNNEINKINYRQSKANQLPSLNLNDTHTLGFGHDLNPVTYQYSNLSLSTNALGLNASIVLFSGLKYINLIRENRLTYEAGNLDIQKQSNDLMLNVIAAYMQVLFEYDAIEIALTETEITRVHLSYTEKYVRAGSMAESTLLQIRAQLASDKSVEVDAKNQLQLAKVTLMQFMEMPVIDDFEIERSNTVDIDPDILITTEDVYNKALTYLPEVKSASIKTNAARTSLKIAKSELLPKLTLGGNLSTSYSNSNSLYSSQTTSNISHIGYLADNPSQIVDGPLYQTTTNSSKYPFSKQFSDNFAQGISINLSVPIFNERLYKSDIARSEIAVKVAKLNENSVNNLVRKNIEIAHADQIAASNNFIATQQQLISEERSYHDMEIKFRVGTINATDLLVEKSLYTKAKIAHLQAKYEYMFKTKVVSFYTGNLTTE